jgi:hypothetical protein
MPEGVSGAEIEPWAGWWPPSPFLVFTAAAAAALRASGVWNEPGLLPDRVLSKEDPCALRLLLAAVACISRLLTPPPPPEVIVTRGADTLLVTVVVVCGAAAATLLVVVVVVMVVVVRLVAPAPARGVATGAAALPPLDRGEITLLVVRDVTLHMSWHEQAAVGRGECWGGWVPADQGNTKGSWQSAAASRSWKHLQHPPGHSPAGCGRGQAGPCWRVADADAG